MMVCLSAILVGLFCCSGLVKYCPGVFQACIQFCCLVTFIFKKKEKNNSYNTHVHNLKKGRGGGGGGGGEEERGKNEIKT